MPRYPFTNHPEGWYFVARSDEMQTGKLKSIRWLGSEIAVWRCEPDDIVSMAVAVCPHMGTRLTPERGAKLTDGLLVCPFHGYSYDNSGTCVATAHPTRLPPTNCRLNMIPVCEVNGMVMGYHGGKPRFHIPELDEEEGWTGKLWGTLPLRTHIQDVVENVVDLNHFLHVHRCKQIGLIERPVIEKYHFKTSLEINGRYNIPFVRNLYYNATVEFHLWGLGYFFWETLSTEFGIRTRNWLFGVPDNDELILHYAVAMREERGSVAGAMRFLPSEMRKRLIRRVQLYETGVTFKQDEDIWNGKSYLEKPRLSSTDGEIFKFRQFCQQFY